MADSYDAVVVGAGVNGLSAGICLAESGLSVLIIEANETIGGAARTAELVRSSVFHDLGSAVHPMGVGSPVFRKLPLGDLGLEWLHPEIPLAHPLDGGRAVPLYRSIEKTVAGVKGDARRYRALFGPLAERWEDLLHEVLQPPIHVPTYPLLLARFGWKALLPAAVLSSAWFSDEEAKALFTGIAAHSNYPLHVPLTSAIGLVLGALSHSVGWPIPQGGAQSISNALAQHFKNLGGEIQTGRRITSLHEVPPAEVIMLDLTPQQIVQIAAPELPPRYTQKLQSYQYGPAAYKLDYILSEPIPWEDKRCRRAGTIHLGGTAAEIVAAEKAVYDGRPADHPYVLVSQPTIFDDTRAPEGVHTAWMYSHVPLGYSGDYAETIERQVERFAPGFIDCIEARYVSTPKVLEAQNANLVGGDISGGSMSPIQIVARPTLRPAPYRTPMAGLYICSSSTPPGGGVHGMCGYNAASAALHDLGLPNTLESADFL